METNLFNLLKYEQIYNNNFYIHVNIYVKCIFYMTYIYIYIYIYYIYIYAYAYIS